jgi:hypothetical protein
MMMGQLPGAPAYPAVWRLCAQCLKSRRECQELPEPSVRWWSERGTARSSFIIGAFWVIAALVTFALALSGVLHRSTWVLGLGWLVVSGFSFGLGFFRRRSERSQSATDPPAGMG